MVSAVATDKQFGRTREAVALANVHEETLKAWAKRGVIPPPKKVGGILFWDLHALRRALGGGDTQPKCGEATVATPATVDWERHFIHVQQ